MSAENPKPLGEADVRTLHAYRHVFENEKGRLVLKHIEGMCRVRHNITREEQRDRPPNPTELAISEGMRRVYWRIVAQLELAAHTKGEPDGES